jgi:riboflavin biosynthesis pyrimidine reductase
MRRVRYRIAASLDGFIADPNGGYDWIITDPAIDFAAAFRQFDTVKTSGCSAEETYSDSLWMPILWTPSRWA